MPHSLSNRQKEILDYLRSYIQKNECCPRLDEIADHFEIKPPTVHKILEALQSKGYLYFGRDNVSGFFIRLIERAGSAELVTEVILAGKFNSYGEVLEYPKEHGHFATVLVGSKSTEVFALFAMADIPSVNICSQDILIFDLGKKPQPGDICLSIIGERFFLIRVASLTYDEITPSLLLAQQYPILENLKNPRVKQLLNWTPLAYSEDTHEYFIQVAEEQKWGVAPIPPELVLATALRLIRPLAF